MTNNVVNPTVRLGEFDFSLVWHCFGNHNNRTTLDDVLRMLSASKSNIIPVNTHRLSKSRSRGDLIIGFGDTTFDDLCQHIQLRRYHVMLNINHQVTAESAVEKTLVAHAMTNEKLIKLEVLNNDMRTSNDGLLIDAVARLRRENPSLIVLPLVSCSPGAVNELVKLGCPLIRVMGSAIGSAAGIADPVAFSEVCKVSVPIVLDGGVGAPEDFKYALDLGAKACLVNSMLFGKPDHPADVLSSFVAALPALTPELFSNRA